MGWSDAGDAGGRGGHVLSLWSEGGRTWTEHDCDGYQTLLDCYLPLLSPQE